MIFFFIVFIFFIFYSNRHYRILFVEKYYCSIYLEFQNKNYLLNIINNKYDLMFKLWKTMTLHNLTKNEIRYIFNQFYPAEKMNQKVYFL